MGGRAGDGLGVLLPRQLNLFSFSGPGSPSVLAKHGCARGSSGRLGGRPGARYAPPRHHRDRAASRCRAGMDRSRGRSRGADVVPKAQWCWCLGANIEGKKESVNALCRRVRQLSQVSG